LESHLLLAVHDMLVIFSLYIAGLAEQLLLLFPSSVRIEAHQQKYR
jgi:hypothetical protein